MMHGNPKDETNDLFSCETINPPTPETIFSLIFVKNFTNCSSRLLEFKSVGIFAISLFVTENLKYGIFLTVYVYFKNKHCQFFTVHS